MLVIENCNSLSDLRQKIIDGEEVRTARYEPCEDTIRREDAINAVSEALEHVFVEYEDIAKKIINKLPSVKPQESCEDAISRQAVLDIIADYDLSMGQVVKGIHALPPVNPTKTGHWIYRIYGEFHEQGNWHCSHCDYQYNYGNGHAKFCPECGLKMSEPPTEEVTRDKDYDWIIKR